MAAIMMTTSAMKGRPAQPMPLPPEQKLTHVRPEYHIRRGRDGKYNAYICEDRVGDRLILTQKLPELAEYCTKLAGEHTDQAVTLSALYQILRVADGTGRTGGWSKHRWRVRPYDLDKEAVSQFENLRSTYSEAIVLGSPHCVVTQPCA